MWIKVSNKIHIYSALVSPCVWCRQNIPTPEDYHQPGSYKTPTPGHSEPPSAHNSPAPAYPADPKRSPQFLAVPEPQDEERAQNLYHSSIMGEGYQRAASMATGHQEYAEHPVDAQYSLHIKYERDDGKHWHCDVTSIRELTDLRFRCSNT